MFIKDILYETILIVEHISCIENHTEFLGWIFYVTFFKTLQRYSRFHLEFDYYIILPFYVYQLNLQSQVNLGIFLREK